MRIILGLLAASVCIGAMAVELSDAQRAAIEERIAPVGKVCLVGDTDCGGGGAMAVAAGPRSGQEVYDAACMACHTSGVAGAPMLGDVDAWAPRIAEGIAALHDAGVNGIPGTGMIAKGGCMDCSDEEVIAAVDYMIESSQ
ncbi:MAG: c-type cytochrome [Pseudomonadota bacterium]